VTPFGTLKDRLAYAWALRAAALRVKPTQENLAAEVSVLMGEEIGQTTAGKWLNGALPRDEVVRLCLAKAVRADPGWLFFGPEHSKAPAPVPSDPVAERAQLDEQRRRQYLEEATPPRREPPLPRLREMPKEGMRDAGEEAARVEEQRGGKARRRPRAG